VRINAPKGAAAPTNQETVMPAQAGIHDLSRRLHGVEEKVVDAGLRRHDDGTAKRQTNVDW
jgi:hypothetical protein